MLLLRVMLLASSVYWPALAAGCDICGCSSGANTFGLLPLVQRSFIGVRWYEQIYRTTAHGSAPNSREFFHTVEFWGRWMPHPRWQMLGLIPFQYHSRRFDDGYEQRLHSLGDASLLVQFALVDPRRQALRRWQHAFQLGLGLKMPTGATQIRDPLRPKEPLPVALQPGSGSADALFSGLYAIQRGRWGASADGIFRVTGTNSNGYRLGPRWNSAVRVFHIAGSGTVRWIPYLGTQLDHRAADKAAGEHQPETGGWAALGFAGVEVFTQGFSLGLSGSLPIVHHMAEGFVAPKHRIAVSATVLLGHPTKAKGKLPAPPFFFKNIQENISTIEQ